jgi:hypothetical protein
MIEPVLALQTAINQALISSSAVTALVSPDHIRAGSTRPDKTPCVIIADGTTTLAGHDYRSQRTAWVHLDLHIWTLDAGEDAAKEIAGVVMRALDGPLVLQGADCDHFRIHASRFPRDPDPAYGHGVLSAEAFIRWVI